MDLELLFSTQPFFVAERSGSGASQDNNKKQNAMFIKPNITAEETLPVPAEALLAAAASSGSSAPVQVFAMRDCLLFVVVVIFTNSFFY